MFRPAFGSGRSVAWLARLFRVQEVVSSNLTAPTILPSGNQVFSPEFAHVAELADALL